MNTVEITEILSYLPHRYPFLLVDRILDIDPGKRIHAIKNVTINEPFFPGHFPGNPVMPGVLILEAMAQTAAILSLKTMGVTPSEDSVYYFVGIDGARFKKPVVPGDQLHLHVDYLMDKRGIWKFKAQAKVDGQLASEAEIMCTVRNSKA